MVVLVVMMMSATTLVIMVVMSLLQQRRRHLRAAGHRLGQLRTGQLVPRRGDDGGGRIVFAQLRHRRGDLIVAQILRARQHDGAGVFHLIVVELTEIFHIHTAFAGVRDRHERAERHLLIADGLDRLHDIRQLAHAGRLDENALRRVGVQHLPQRLAEIAHQRAADTTGVELVDLHAGLLHKAAVDADLAEFVFDQHQFLSGIRLFNELFNQRRLTGTEKPRKNINNRHNQIRPLLFTFPFIIHRLSSAHTARNDE